MGSLRGVTLCGLYVYGAGGKVYCWGCSWHGDFVGDFRYDLLMTECSGMGFFGEIWGWRR